MVGQDEEVRACSWQWGSPGKGWQPPFPRDTLSPVPAGCSRGGFGPRSIVRSKAETGTLWVGAGGPKGLLPWVVG